MALADLQGQRIALYGYGREGRSVLMALRRYVADLEVSILSDTPVSDAPDNIHCITGTAVAAALMQFDVVIKSPGISRYKPSIQAAQAQGVLFTSATRLWFAEYPQARTVCITGTKGKSTTSSLVAHLINSLGKRAVFGGNIGTPLFDLPLPNMVDVYILELSSYQTSDFDGLTDVALLLNLFPEHLDWHGSVETYFTDKSHLLSHAKHIIANATDAHSQAYLPKKKIHYFNHPQSWHVQAGQIFYKQKLVLNADSIPLLGAHNLSNLCAALSVLEALKLDTTQALLGLSSFQALPHRLCLLGERANIRYVDDSISTTPQSTIAAIKAFPHQAITVLIGGYDRGIDHQILVDFILQKTNIQLIAMPNTGLKVAEAIRQKGRETGIFIVANLLKAVALAQEITPQSGLILLSPAAPSYGFFDNFQQRGIAFAQAAGFNASPEI